MLNAKWKTSTLWFRFVAGPCWSSGSPKNYTAMELLTLYNDKNKLLSKIMICQLGSYTIRHCIEWTDPNCDCYGWECLRGFEFNLANVFRIICVYTRWFFSTELLVVLNTHLCISPSDHLFRLKLNTRKLDPSVHNCPKNFRQHFHLW
jgi:hypothetical protein